MYFSFYFFVLAFSLRVVFILFQGADLESKLIEDELLYWKNSLFFLDSGHIDKSILYERMPGAFFYFKFLLWASSKDLQIVLFLQALVDSFTCLFIYFIAKILVPKEKKYIFLSAICSPLMIILTSQILSETIFLFLFVLFLLFSIKSIYSEKSKKVYKLMLLSGVFLGLATFIRSISFPLIFVVTVPLAIILLKKGRVKYEVIISLFVFIFFAFLPISKRLLENINNHNVFSLTAQTGSHLAYWVTPLVLSEKEKINRSDALKIILKKKEHYNFSDNPYQNDKLLQKISIDLLSNIGFHNIIAIWSKGIIINIFSPSFLLDKKLRNLPHPSFYEISNPLIWLKTLYNDSKYHKYLFFLLMSSISSLFSIFSIILGNILLYRKDKIVFSLCLLYMAYFLLITGPVLSPKYIFPILPCIFLYQGITLLKIKVICISLCKNIRSS